ncbi:maleylacetoacetate isomerase [Roseomonas stagni]|uniref:Maleylacetoacetate isomerase n=1 Tax=Falsiroseomonas algicola TaxID=2716930 RepID=A0A6M1LHD2_9PROT|nr:maleylacetoacetate isomerase [Falsiroseomonas algicola]NGM19641.1 maleylacetoacetate isomerase [Falsiroseomonas algicola]
MVLQGYFRSSAAWRVRIALNLKGLGFATVARHLRKREQAAPDYVAKNPQGLVPALEVPGQGVLTQSLAIIEWLEETKPLPPLLPADPWGRARVRSLAQIVACDIHPIQNLRVLAYLKHELGQEQPAIDAFARHWIEAGLAALEARLAREAETGRFCHGDAPGLADLCLVPQLGNARRFGVELSPYPTVLRIEAACAALPAFQDATPDRQPDAE